MRWHRSSAAHFPNNNVEDLASTTAPMVDLYLTVLERENGMGTGAQMKFSNDSINWSPAELFS